MTYDTSYSLAGNLAIEALDKLIDARRECIDPAELERINKAIGATHEVVEPRKELRK